MERFGLCDLCEIIQLGEQNSSHLESQIRMHCFEENETLIFLKRLWRHLLKTHLLFRPYALRNLSPSISAILAKPSWRLSKSTDLLKNFQRQLWLYEHLVLQGKQSNRDTSAFAHDFWPQNSHFELIKTG